MILAGVFSTLTGCAAVNPPPQCHCPQCEQQWDEQQVLIDFQQGFRKYVLGTEVEQDTPPENLQRAQRRRVAQRSKTAVKPPIQKASGTAELEKATEMQLARSPAVPARPMPPSVASSHALPPAAAVPAAYEMPACPPMGPPPVVAPPPRFFPVPARPVFSPQPVPLGYRVPGHFEPTPMSNWGESTDASL